MDGSFSPVILKDFSGGWVSTRDKDADALALNESPDLQNVDFNGQGSFEIRPGYELFADRDSTAGSTYRLYNFRRPIQNDEIVVAQFGTTLKYVHPSLGTWQTLPTVGSLTTNIKVGFASYTATADVTDFLYLCDGASVALQRWTGYANQLNGALAGGEATITVDSTTGASATGSIDIGGTTVTYTGITATTFTGCSGTPAAADNLPIEQVPIAFAATSGTKPLGNILAILNNQLVVATSQFVSLSDTDNFLAWGAGLASKKGFKEGRVTGLAVKDKKLVVYTTNTVQSLEYEFTGDLTGFQIRVEDIENAAGAGCKSFTSVCNLQNTIIYAAADNSIREISRLTGSTLFGTNNISRNIQKTLAKYNLSNAASITFRNKVYIAVQSDESSINDTVLVFDLKYAQQNPSKEAWTKYRMYVSDFMVYGGLLYFGSSAEQNVFRLFETLNGSVITDDDGGAISWYYKIPQLDFGKPELKARIRKVVSRGFISTNALITYTASFDYSTENSQDLTLSGSDDAYVSIPAAAALGEEILGEAALGDGDDPFEGQYPFTYPDEYGTVDAYNTQITISGNTKNERYKQTKLIIYAELEADEVTA